jgi:hypothetical protein
MIGSVERPHFDAQAFDDSFFSAYEEQLSDISVEEQASIALKEILTVEKENGTQKTYDEIKEQTQTFFSNDWVRNDEIIMNRMTMEFAQACMGHNHGAELAQDGQLGSVFDAGLNNLNGDKHDHKHDGQSHKDKDDDEIETKTGKKKKKRYVGFFSIFSAK